MDIKHRIELIKLLPERPITVELGVAEGNFSLDICEQWSPRKHYAVDNWGTIENTTGDGNFHQLWHNMNFHTMLWRLRSFPQVKKLIGITWEMANVVPDDSVDLVYIDAGHSYESVKNDLTAWFPKAKRGGVIAFHDYLMPQYGVQQAAQEFCRERFELKIIPENKSEDAGAYFIKS